ncbi:MAG: hypothetical protein FWH02_07530 [Oscillospiraceae bacterium]|nr:hypothetical protein [Oscillospiraceae bacterium]
MPNKKLTGRNRLIISMIEIAASFDAADKIIEEFTGLSEIKDKIDFLFDNFDIAIVGNCIAEIDKPNELLIQYEAMLTTIVNRKWR